MSRSTLSSDLIPDAIEAASPRPFVAAASAPVLAATGLSCLLLLLSGCADEAATDDLSMPVLPSVSSVSDPPEAVIREVGKDELRELVDTSERPVLVEFSVLSGCYRCDDMRSPIRQKAAELQQQADVVRIDFNLNHTLAQNVGATVCPSYVVYSEGKVASVRTWPTSADFVAEDVRAAVGTKLDDAASKASAHQQTEGSLP
ncbi:thioredoxin domain-containing protein [Fuerstiella marisgermanici]|uniref:Thioredoxin n=1 Tax=Fuerstiella marisgermanici TaxID=1891926 RepID=A0A1P8WLD8_9PLAN|nr:thioredoxin family protein [Fuerstiella marisgermanici]APZ94876.1 thioredoxin [Fuerstiella marisgermanici]